MGQGRAGMAKNSVTLASTVVASKNQVSTELGGEAVVLGVEAGEYFGLNEVAASVWGLVQKPIRVSAICTSISADYEVSAPECERDVLELLNDLENKGLIDVSAAVGAP